MKWCLGSAAAEPQTLSYDKLQTISPAAEPRTPIPTPSYKEPAETGTRKKKKKVGQLLKKKKKLDKIIKKAAWKKFYLAIVIICLYCLCENTSAWKCARSCLKIFRRFQRSFPQKTCETWLTIQNTTASDTITNKIACGKQDVVQPTHESISTKGIVHFLFLVKDRIELPLVWRAFFGDDEEDNFKIWIHCSDEKSCSMVDPVLSRHATKIRRVHSEWCLDLVALMHALLEAAHARGHENDHYVFLSDDAIPVKSSRTMKQDLAASKRSMVRVSGTARKIKINDGKDFIRRFFPIGNWIQSKLSGFDFVSTTAEGILKSSQWLTLTRHDASLVLKRFSSVSDISDAKEYLLSRFQTLGCFDEHFFLWALYGSLHLPSDSSLRKSQGRSDVTPGQKKTVLLELFHKTRMVYDEDVVIPKHMTWSAHASPVRVCSPEVSYLACLRAPQNRSPTFFYWTSPSKDQCKSWIKDKLLINSSFSKSFPKKQVLKREVDSFPLWPVTPGSACDKWLPTSYEEDIELQLAMRLQDEHAFAKPKLYGHDTYGPHPQVLERVNAKIAQFLKNSPWYFVRKVEVMDEKTEMDMARVMKSEVYSK